jgi:hypothetical protein
MPQFSPKLYKEVMLCDFLQGPRVSSAYRMIVRETIYGLDDDGWPLAPGEARLMHNLCAQGISPREVGNLIKFRRHQ